MVSPTFMLPLSPSSTVTWFISALVLAFSCIYSLRRSRFPPKSPNVTHNDWPIVGDIGFFTKRWEWFRDAAKASKTGNFSFHAGGKHIIGVSGPVGRKVFFESKNLSLDKGYSILIGSTSRGEPVDENGDSTFQKYFSQRIVHFMKKDTLAERLPLIIADARNRLQELVDAPRNITNPFESIYRMVFQLTVRVSGPDEISDDLAKLDQALYYYEMFEDSISATNMLFPYLPTVSRFKQFWSMTKLYTIMNSIIKTRRKTGERRDDPLQYLLDKGDDVQHIMSYIVGTLFAGLLNGGINAAYLLCYLALDPVWMSRIREEVSSAASRYATNKDAPLIEQLSALPIDVWETEFKNIDICLKDSMRLQLLGAAMRQNIGATDIKVGDEVIPPGAYVAYHLGDTHYDPEVFKDPLKWDPSRYLPERAEDKKMPYAATLWGHARHPCLGMRFAKLEMYVIVACFVAMFDFTLVEKDGTPMKDLPPVNLNSWTARKPVTNVYLKYTART